MDGIRFSLRKTRLGLPWCKWQSANNLCLLAAMAEQPLKSFAFFCICCALGPVLLVFFPLALTYQKSAMSNRESNVHFQSYMYLMSNAILRFNYQHKPNVDYSRHRFGFVKICREN